MTQLYRVTLLLALLLLQAGLPGCAAVRQTPVATAPLPETVETNGGATALAQTPAPPPPAPVGYTAWRPLFQGVAFCRRVNQSPLPMACYAVRIDLKAPGVRLITTPPNPSGKSEVIAERTSTFLERLRLQLAVNASPFEPVALFEGAEQNVVGLAVHQGQTYSQPQPGYVTLNVLRDGTVRFEEQLSATEDVVEAITGFGWLLREGRVVAPMDEERHPRTAVGRSQDGRYLLLLVIDGRQASHSTGATQQETAHWLRDLGAWEGINLDGGGSSTLVIDNGKGRAKVLNRPIHMDIAGRERPCGSHLGVYALPLP